MARILHRNQNRQKGAAALLAPHSIHRSTKKMSPKLLIFLACCLFGVACAMRGIETETDGKYPVAGPGKRVCDEAPTATSVSSLACCCVALLVFSLGVTFLSGIFLFPLPWCVVMVFGSFVLVSFPFFSFLVLLFSAPSFCCWRMFIVIS